VSAGVAIPLVDTHAHVFRRDLPFIPGATHHFERDFTIDDYLAALDNNGVGHGVVVAASFLGTYNDYTLEALRRSDRLRGTVILEPGVTDTELRALDAAGVVGLRLSVGNLPTPPDLRSPGYRTLLGKLRELDWHVHFFARPEHVVGILDALEESGVKTVVDHFGARDATCGEHSAVFGAVCKAMAGGRTWTKLSAPYWSERLDHGRLAKLLLEAGGPERILWGSDWPFTKLDGRLDYRRTIDWLHGWLPDPAIWRQTDRNALALYRFPEGASS
jgi:predicted TIM-barrel fold metal-dependent hydrolase